MNNLSYRRTKDKGDSINVGQGICSQIGQSCLRRYTGETEERREYTETVFDVIVRKNIFAGRKMALFELWG